MEKHTLLDPLLLNYRGTSFNIGNLPNISNICFNFIAALIIIIIFVCLLLWQGKKNKVDKLNKQLNFKRQFFS